MSKPSLPALRRDPSFCAEAPRFRFQRIWAALRSVFREPGDDLPRLSPHLARDIGLSEADMSARDVELPSQMPPHPRS